MKDQFEEEDDECDRVLLSLSVFFFFFSLMIGVEEVGDEKGSVVSEDLVFGLICCQ